jgi:hypothetical protein
VKSKRVGHPRIGRDQGDAKIGRPDACSPNRPRGENAPQRAGAGEYPIRCA